MNMDTDTFKSFTFDIPNLSRKKEKLILSFFDEYKKVCKIIKKIILKEFFMTGKIPEFMPSCCIKTSLSARQVSFAYSLVKGVFKSFFSLMGNRIEKSIRYLYRYHLRGGGSGTPPLSEEDLNLLFEINRRSLWNLRRDERGLFVLKVGKDKKEIVVPEHVRLIIRSLFHFFWKRWEKPNVNNLPILMDIRMIDKKRSSWITSPSGSDISWLTFNINGKDEKKSREYRKVCIPVKRNKRAEKLPGQFSNTFTLRRVKTKDSKRPWRFFLSRAKRVTLTKQYEVKRPVVAIDLGFSPFIATSTGRKFLKRFRSVIAKYDAIIQPKISAYQKALAEWKKKKELGDPMLGPRPSLYKDPEYVQTREQLKGFLKSAINRAINKIIQEDSPKYIIKEIFFPPQEGKTWKISRKMNRFLKTMGKSFLEQKLKSVNKEFGVEVLSVNPAYTSQTCSRCGFLDKGNRKNTQVFVCKHCGLEINAQYNAALNIEKRGIEKINESPEAYDGLKPEEVKRRILDKFFSENPPPYSPEVQAVYEEYIELTQGESTNTRKKSKGNKET